MLDVIREFPDRSWSDRIDADAPTGSVERLLEEGRVLSFPALAFELQPGERRLVDPRHADPRSKNINLRRRPGDPRAEFRGALGTPDELAALQALLARYADHAEGLVRRLCPHYTHRLQRASTSLRPMALENRLTSWRQDDTRLHVDAFPSNPMQGRRLLRVFSNVHPLDVPRVWRVGEPFEAFARRYLPRVRRPLPGSARLLQSLKLTKARRTEYDHVMLRLHDLAKADAAYQTEAAQQRWSFMPGTTWVVYSDQVLHAAMSGQHMLEQTFVLEPKDLLHPEASPLHTLQRLLGRPLLS